MFGDKLRYLREHQELSQQEAAQKLNISQSTYNRYERGQREPDFATLKRIAQFYGVSADYLLDLDAPVADTIDLVDLLSFLAHGHYTIFSQFPSPRERQTLRDLVSLFFRHNRQPA